MEELNGGGGGEEIFFFWGSWGWGKDVKREGERESLDDYGCFVE